MYKQDKELIQDHSAKGVGSCVVSPVPTLTILCTSPNPVRFLYINSVSWLQEGFWYLSIC